MRKVGIKQTIFQKLIIYIWGFVVSYTEYCGLTLLLFIIVILVFNSVKMTKAIMKIILIIPQSLTLYHLCIKNIT